MPLPVTTEEARAYCEQLSDLLKDWTPSPVRCHDCTQPLTATSYICQLCDVLVCEPCRHVHTIGYETYTIPSP